MVTQCHQAHRGSERWLYQHMIVYWLGRRMGRMRKGESSREVCVRVNVRIRVRITDVHVIHTKHTNDKSTNLYRYNSPGPEQALGPR